MTGLAPPDTTAHVSRKLEFPEKFSASFERGTLTRVKAALDDGEDQRALVREAVKRELSRRARTPKKEPR